MEFINNYQLLVLLDQAWDTAPQSLVLVDTEKVVEGAPMQTTFRLSPHFNLYPSFLLERGAHKPSPAESLAPFYQDPNQRIVALSPQYHLGFLVFRVGALSKLLESHEGSEIGWDEWKSHVINSPIDQDLPETPEVLDACVFGCRLFSISSVVPVPDAKMRAFDFSIQGRANYLSEEVNANVGGVRCMLPTGARAQVLGSDLFNTHSSHGSIIFTYVSVALFCSPRERD